MRSRGESRFSVRLGERSLTPARSFQYTETMHRDRDARLSSVRACGRWEWRTLVTSLLVLAVALPAAGQTNVTLDVNLPLFSVLSALHAAGYEPGQARQAMPPVRARLLEDLARVQGPATDALREFYRTHRRSDPGANLSRYVSFALVVEGPPSFEYKMPRIQLPPDVLELEGLNERLRDFSAEAKLDTLWQKYQPRYEEEIARLQPPIANALLLTEAYLRLPPPSFAGRQYRIYFDLLLEPNLTFARNYGDDYFLVLSPATDQPLDEIRHAYLHFLLDPIAGKYSSLIATKKELYPVALRAQLLPEDFRSDFTLFTTECLIKAAEIRLQRLTATRAAEIVDAAEKQGFVLTRYFYDALAQFEQVEPSIKLYFPELIQPINVASELARLEQVEFAQRAATLAQPVTTLEALLRDAENAIAAGDYARARQSFRVVLERYGADQPRALYGLAVVAGLERDWALAKQYFLRTLEKAQDPVVLAWSHVYLGRIYDVEGNRALAMGEYEEALRTGAPSPEVQQAARRGLEKPFGPARPATEPEEKNDRPKN